IASGSCSTSPGPGRICSNSCWAIATWRPSPPNKIARDEGVPCSCAKISDSMNGHHWTCGKRKQSTRRQHAASAQINPDTARPVCELGRSRKWPLLEGDPLFERLQQALPRGFQRELVIGGERFDLGRARSDGRRVADDGPLVAFPLHHELLFRRH